LPLLDRGQMNRARQISSIRIVAAGEKAPACGTGSRVFDPRRSPKLGDALIWSVAN